ncbi:MAG TPA: DUF885 domain-containing protein [Pyrinomonadaceae bacterium]|jgi:uncharacterized protein (DUF885 family)|nr:DUF885 domain-containing protein [Pyrinomonadaceae bacterium]
MRKLLLLTAALVLTSAAACVQQTAQQNANQAQASDSSGDQNFKRIHDAYVRDFLRRNPTVNTYLGGAGLDPALRDVDGQLRDHSAAAIEAEDRWLTDTQKSLEAIAPGTLSPTLRIDREVALAQIRFLLHQHGTRKYQQRALDTYTDEPFRAVDWQLQGMTQTGEKTYGTPEEWSLVVKRLQAVPRYFQVAQEQLAAGVKSGNTPDHRMLLRNGITTAEKTAQYFEKTLPDLAAERIAQGAGRDEQLKQLNEAAKGAAGAYRALRDYVAQNFFDNASQPTAANVKAQFRADRFAMGEDEYNWALKNNLRMPDATAGKLFDESMAIVNATQAEMVTLAREIGKKKAMELPEDGHSAVLAVFEELGKDYPKSDAEMVKWYEEAAFRLVEYGRKSGVFDVPADYKLEVVETPPPLRASIDGAAYYPAPPFKTSGVGRFYVTTSGSNDEAVLKENNRASLADLAAHEGFPGHDWHYKVMTQYRERIAPARWLTPGAVEDSSSMWQDSMAAEGWGLYSEALMAEPQPGFPTGFYSPEERLYQLKGKLYRDLRVRIDTGIHTGRMSYDDAVDLFSQVVDFQPGSCRDAAAVAAKPAKRASCDSAERAIFRYSKWPTQAITYRLGKDQIFALRKDAAQIAGDRFSPRDFHVLFMQQGTIPVGYFREELLKELQAKK